MRVEVVIVLQEGVTGGTPIEIEFGLLILQSELLPQEVEGEFMVKV